MFDDDLEEDSPLRCGGCADWWAEDGGPAGFCGLLFAVTNNDSRACPDWTERKIEGLDEKG